MKKEEIYYNIYTWGIRKEGQTLSEKECKELVCIAQEYADQKTKELTDYKTSTKVHVLKLTEEFEKQRKELEHFKECAKVNMTAGIKADTENKKLKAEAKEKDEYLEESLRILQDLQEFKPSDKREITITKLEKLLNK